MGHRKTHHRDSGGKSLDHLKEKCDGHESSHGGSKREKRSHRRKKEHNDDSMRRHRNKPRGNHSSSRSSSKGKSRDKVHRQKGVNSVDSDSSNSFPSFERVHKLGSTTQHSGVDMVPKSARRTKTDLDDEGCRKRYSKRVRLSKEKSSSHDAIPEPWRTKIEEHQGTDSEPGEWCQHAGAVFSSNREGGIVKPQEEGMGSERKNNNVLEVELRHKALANFMQRQDVSCRTGNHSTSLDGEAKDRQTPAIGNPSKIDVTKDGKVCSGSHVAVSPNNADCLAEENVNSLEEGEIKNENRTEDENGSSVGGKTSHKNKERDLHGSREIFEKEGGSRITSGRKVERAGASNVPQILNVKQEPAKEKARNGNTAVDFASAQSNSSNNLQEKTMSVMRGGEMVQVSYKVYIPQRAAELARRRLQR